MSVPMEWLSSLRSLWESGRAKISLSVFCIAIALFDTFLKSLSPVAAGALAIAVVPWVLQFIEKISAPGGFEIVFAKVKQQLDDSEAALAREDIEAFEHFASDDPNLSIALLRVEIERRLRQLGEKFLSEKQYQRRSLRALTDELQKSKIISDEAAALVRDLMPVMNEAVHGHTLRSDATAFAKEYGPKVLAQIRSVQIG